MVDRRNFLKASTLLSLAPTVPEFLARTARAAAPLVAGRGRVLVVVQLDGGNDGINTVVPHADPGYARHRRKLRLPAGKLVRIDDRVGLHPAMADAGRLLDAGQLAVVQGVSYPNPSRSHFQSMSVWHSARLDVEEHRGPGWLGRALDGGDGAAATSLAVGPGLPPAIRGRRSVASSLSRPEDFLLSPGADPRGVIGGGPGDDLTAFVRRSMLDAYTSADRFAEATRRDNGAAVRYPQTALAGHLELVARLLEAGFGARVYYTLQTGYDTHAAQLPTHARLVAELAGAVKAFLDDLAAARLADPVAVLMFSEFGRTVAENGSGGTDHGTSGPVLLAGPRVRAGLVGSTPSLSDLDPNHGDLRTGLDFRRVYATVLEDWLGMPARAALGGAFERLPLFRG